MANNDERALNELLYLMQRQYPTGCSTFGPCLTEGCEKSARGSGRCGDCIAEALGELIGNPAEAIELRNLSERKSRLEVEIRERYYLEHR